MINHFKGPYNFLSNFSFHPVQIEQTNWPTVEHAYQAAKSLNPTDHQRMLDTISPSVAKRLGRAVKCRDDWE